MANLRFQNRMRAGKKITTMLLEDGLHHYSCKFSILILCPQALELPSKHIPIAIREYCSLRAIQDVKLSRNAGHAKSTSKPVAENKEATRKTLCNHLGDSLTTDDSFPQLQNSTLSNPFCFKKVNLYSFRD